MPQQRHFGGGIGTNAGGWGNWRPAASNYMSSRGTRNNWPNVTDLDAHGMFAGHVAHSIADCTDGTSNTFLIGERDTRFCRSGTRIGVRNPQGNLVRGFYYNTANVRVPLNAPDPPYAWNSRAGCSEGFSSMHPAGANFALADGSLRFISDTIEFRGNPPGCCANVGRQNRCCYDSGVGPHTVSISTYNEVPGEDGNDQVIPERVPAQYNVNTDLTRNVEQGSNEFNFDLQGNGQIITHIE